MIQNALLATSVFLALVSAGHVIGAKVSPEAPLEARVMTGVSLAIAYSGLTVVLVILIPGIDRLWFVVASIPLLVLAVIGVAGWRKLAESPAFIAGLLLVLASALIVASPYVVPGEFDSGSIYATRIPGRPADNRLPYRSVQFVWNELDPQTSYFLDWAITDRTQLSTGPAALVVALTGADLPSDELWYREAESVAFRSVDPFGYWAVRNALIALNGLLPLGVAALAAVWFDRRVAWVAALASSLTVFSIVETAFTWPKFAAVAVACGAAANLLLSRPILGGALSGVAYLLHPVGGLLLPAAVWLGWRRGTLHPKSILLVLGSSILVVLPWLAWVSIGLGRSSRMVLYPIGWVLTSGTSLREELPLALEAFWRRFPLGLLEDRWVSLRESIDITKFVAAADSATPRIALFQVYDRTLPGMLGLAQLVPFSVGVIIAVKNRTRLVLSGLIVLATVLLMWGVWPRALGADTLQPVVPILAIGAAIGFRRHPRMRWLLAAAAIESFVILDLAVLQGSSDSWPDVVTTTVCAAVLAGLAIWGMNLVEKSPATPEALSPLSRKTLE